MKISLKITNAIEDAYIKTCNKILQYISRIKFSVQIICSEKLVMQIFKCFCI